MSYDDPLITFTREPTQDELQKILQALTQLQNTARDKGYKGKINTPQEWVILDRLNIALGFALGDYGVIYKNTIEGEHLDAVLAHIIGWYNKPNSQTQPAYEILHLRDQSAPFNLKRLPQFEFNSQDTKLEEYKTYGDEFGLDERKRLREIKTKTHSQLRAIGLPEDLRPKPVDVALGGGNSYGKFAYSMTHQYTADVTENSEDNARGHIAVMEYMEQLELQGYKYQDMVDYFAKRETHAHYFKQVQKFADLYASLVFSKHQALIELLTKYDPLSATDSQQTNHFYNPIPQRLEYLKKLSSL